MFRKLRVLCVVCLMTVLGLTFSGCGNNSAVEDKDDMSKEVKLVWYSYREGISKDDAKVLAKANEYLKEKLNVVLDIRYLGGGGEYEQKIKTMAAAGEQLDLCFTASWILDYRVYSGNGYFLAIDDVLEKYGQDAKKAVNPILWNGTQINGKHYAVPNNQEICTNEYLVFNKQLLEGAGIDPASIKSSENVEKTYADLENVFAAVNAKYPGKGHFISNERFYNYDFIFSEYAPGAVRMDDKGVTIINQFEDPDFLAICKEFFELRKKGYKKDDPPETGWRAGNSLMTIMDKGMNPEYSISKSTGFPVVAVPMYAKPAARTMNMGGSMIAISATSQNPIRAMKFLNLLNSDKYLRNLIAYGIEGEHFTKVGDNKIKLLKPNTDYNTYIWTNGDEYLTYEVEGNPGTDWEKCRKFSDSARISPLVGFMFNSEPVKTELSALMNKVQEYSGGIINGKLDIEKAAGEYVKQMKACGWDKIHAEMQKQVDEWKKTKK